MKDICSDAIVPRCVVARDNNTSMSKSNPSALNGLLRMHGGESLLKNHPHPELSKGAQHMADYRSGSEISHQWSDSTFTGSGRCSAYSWGLDEAEFDRVAAESVRKKFDRINAFLFEGKSTGISRVDEECNEWSTTFPHLEVKGQHMLDTMEDGTEMVTPELLLDAPTTSDPSQVVGTDVEGQDENKLMVIGRKTSPVAMELDKDETSPLYEEVFVEDGLLEEYFAFDKTDEVLGPVGSGRSKWRRHHAVPPVTPNACVQDAVQSAAFAHLWSEVIGVLHPLLEAIRENTQAAQDGSFSVVDRTLTPAQPNMADSPEEQSYVLPEIIHPPSYGKTFGQSDAKLPRWKYTAPSVPSNYGSSYAPTTANLSGVMQIRAVALQQRGHSSFIPSMLPIGGNSREGTPLYPTLNDRPESSVTAPRLGKLTTPLPPRTDLQIPPTPGSSAIVANRLTSSHLTSRRNINTAILRPIEKPKTPGLLPMDNNGIRGLQLVGNTLHYSPPSTPFVRHSQLPPLEVSSSNHSAVGSSRIPPSHSYMSDKSPTTQHRISGHQKNRVTFNSRVASAAEDPEMWNYARVISGAGSDLRPNTTNISLRPLDGQVKSSYGIGRKVSEGSAYLGRMKVVGHAAGVHGGGGGEVIYGIDEDTELEEAPKSFTITGKSGIVQSKPHSVSSKTKSRAQFR